MPTQRAPIGQPLGEPSALWLLSDPQLHNPAGAPTRSKLDAIDQVAKVAIRPPSLDLWADVVLESIVSEISAETRQTRAPVVALGDAANVSCIGEFERFLLAMKPLSWLGVPGNHDGYYLGNMTFRPDAVIRPRRNSWQGACQYSVQGGAARFPGLEKLERRFLEDIDGKGGLTYVKQGTLPKSHAVWMYLIDLAERMEQKGVVEDLDRWEASAHAYHYALEGELANRGLPIKVSARATIARLTEKEKKREKSRAWQASIVQDVTLPDQVHILLIDTADYAHTPPSSIWQFRAVARVLRKRCGEAKSGTLLPGKCGEVSKGQEEMIEALTKKWSTNTRFLMMGHHPWASLSAESQARLARLRSRSGFMTYVSGHIHTPAATRGNDRRSAWEINLGSTTDWPMEYSRLSYWPQEPLSQGTPLQLDVHYAASAMQCPYATVEDAERELDYGTVARYTSTALNAYGKLMTALQQSGSVTTSTASPRIAQIERLRDRCQRLQSLVREPEGEPREDLRRIPMNNDLERCRLQQRRLLAELIDFDRSYLRRIPRARELEGACAIWASGVECAKNDCSGLTVRGAGGSPQRLSFAFRVPPGLFSPRPSPPGP